MDDKELEEFIEKLEEHYIDPKEIIHCMDIRDVLVCMDYVYDELANMPIDKIEELIAIGTNAIGNFPWHDVITLALIKARRKENG